MRVSADIAPTVLASLADTDGYVWTTIAEIRAARWSAQTHEKFPRGVPVWWARQRMQETRQALGLRYQGT